MNYFLTEEQQFIKEIAATVAREKILPVRAELDEAQEFPWEIVKVLADSNLFGVYIHGAADSVVEGNVISGRSDVRLSEAGDGVSIWNAPGAQVIGNTISRVRDGIFVKTSAHNEFVRNAFTELRFAIHYMYTNDSVIEDNVSVDNTVGYAIMFSDRLRIAGNVSDGDRDHGMLFNYANQSQILGNHVRGHAARAEAPGAADAEDREHAALATADDSGARPGRKFQFGATRRGRIQRLRCERAWLISSVELSTSSILDSACERNPKSVQIACASASW